MKKKVIFLDVDGTLVDYEGNLPDAARRKYIPISGRSDWMA